MGTKSVRGKAANESTVVDSKGKVHDVDVPDTMIGKNVIIRNGKVTERINSKD